MAIPLPTLKAFEKTRVDLAIDTFAKLENPTISDLNYVKTQANIQCRIEMYRLGAVDMTRQQLRDECHSSARMATSMVGSTDPRPSQHCDCHAMVSGKHALAAPMRAVMAWCMMRIDDPRNGCWLPRDWGVRSLAPQWLRNAVPHQGLHNPKYYEWLNAKINIDIIEDMDDLIGALRMVRTQLQSGALPPAAWPKKKVN